MSKYLLERGSAEDVYNVVVDGAVVGELKLFRRAINDAEIAALPDDTLDELVQLETRRAQILTKKKS